MCLVHYSKLEKDSIIIEEKGEFYVFDNRKLHLLYYNEIYNEKDEFINIINKLLKQNKIARKKIISAIKCEFELPDPEIWDLKAIKKSYDGLESYLKKILEKKEHNDFYKKIDKITINPCMLFIDLKNESKVQENDGSERITKFIQDLIFNVYSWLGEFPSEIHIKTVE